MNVMGFIINHSPLFYLFQPLWRDEAFSVFMANPSTISGVINHILNDFNPPLYYLSLHYIIKIFGEETTSLRLYSFIFHLGTTVVAYYLFRKLFIRKIAIFGSLFTFLNPMLIYYAFELRMYSMYAFFCFASISCLLTKRYKLFVFATILGLYIHSFFALVVLGEMIYLLLTKSLNKKLIYSFLSLGLLYLPWTPTLTKQFADSKVNWIFPVDLNLIGSVLGNLFTNYEGTPGYLWAFTFGLSVIIISFSLFVFIHKKKEIGLPLVYMYIILPLILIYSSLRQPVYVNRYMIFVSVAEIITIVGALNFVKNTRTQYFAMILLISFSLGFNIWYPDKHPKTDFHTPLAKIAKTKEPGDYILADPLSFFEAYYYYPDRTRVFLYSPGSPKLPRYLGTAAFSSDKIITEIPKNAKRIFLIHKDGTYDERKI